MFERPITDLETTRQVLLKLLEYLKDFNPDTLKKNLADMFLGGINIYYSSDNYYKLEGEK